MHKHRRQENDQDRLSPMQITYLGLSFACLAIPIFQCASTSANIRADRRERELIKQADRAEREALQTTFTVKGKLLKKLRGDENGRSIILNTEAGDFRMKFDGLPLTDQKIAMELKVGATYEYEFYNFNKEKVIFWPPIQTRPVNPAFERPVRVPNYQP